MGSGLTRVLRRTNACYVVPYGKGIRVRFRFYLGGGLFITGVIMSIAGLIQG